MIVKIVPPGSDGSTLRYLLSTDRAARPLVLTGNPALLAAMIARSGSAEPYAMLCLSFAERAEDLAPGIVPAILASTEAMMFAGMDLRCIARTAIQHTDKAGGRLEINLVVLNKHLGSGKVFSSYVHSRDGRLFPMWAELVSRRYNLSSGNAATTVRGYRIVNSLPIWQKENAVIIGRSVAEAVGKGSVTCRADVIDHLQVHGYLVVGSDPMWLEVGVGKGPALRLRGDYYREGWEAGVSGPATATQRLQRELREMPTALLEAQVAGRVRRRGEILGEQVRRRPRQRPSRPPVHAGSNVTLDHMQQPPILAASGALPKPAPAGGWMDELSRRARQRLEEWRQGFLIALRIVLARRARLRDAEAEAGVAAVRRRHRASVTALPPAARTAQRNAEAEVSVAVVRGRFRQRAATLPSRDHARERESQALAQVSARRARSRAGTEVIDPSQLAELAASAPAPPPSSPAQPTQPPTRDDSAQDRRAAKLALVLAQLAETDALTARWAAGPEKAPTPAPSPKPIRQSTPAPAASTPAAPPLASPPAPAPSRVPFHKMPPAAGGPKRDRPGLSDPRRQIPLPRRPKRGPS